jgi:RNA polymerase sigma factor (sigma-70 family)
MATGVMSGVLRRLRRVALTHDGGGLTDGELLEAFIAGRDEAAFAALARRHGPMVLGVCRRVLGNQADAEDAFQVTFLVLVKKATSIMPRSMVGNWLYGVAHNTALKAKAMNGKRRVKEKLAAQRSATARPAEANQLTELLDAELSRLPDKYRVPVVLCDLEGKPIKEAARQLGWPQGTVASRLARARRLLAKGMARHGLVFSGAALAVLIAEGAALAAVPAVLMDSMLQAATGVAAGGAAAAVSSAQVAALFERTMRTMWMRSLNAAALTLLAVLGLGFGAFLAQVPAQEKPAAGATKPAPHAGAQDAARPGRLYFQINMDLATVAPDGKDTKHLKAISPKDISENFQPHSARLSPDGKRLAFGKAVMRRTADSVGVWPPDKLYVRDVSQSAVGEVVAELDGTELHEWCWSPDGTKLALTSWDADHFTRNWIVDLKTKKLREVTLPRFKYKDKEYSMSIQAWSPDGGSFLVSGAGLFLVKTDGNGARRLTNGDIDLMGGTCRFSPDGRRVLYVGVGEKHSMKLHVTDVADGKTAAVVDVLNFTDIYACWSPDSRRIAYSATLLGADGERGGETSLFVMDADGNNMVTLRTEKHEPLQIRMQMMDWR